MLIPNKLKEVLTEEQLNEIKAEYEKQVELRIESALHQYDDDAVEQIKLLESQINQSHARKLTEISNKYKNVINTIQRKHEEEMTAKAQEFKIRLAEQIEKFIDHKINNIVPFDTIKEYAKNKTAATVLESLRKQLAVDSTLMKESVRKPINEIKSKYDSAVEYIKKLEGENKNLVESVNMSKANLLIESKVAGLDEKTADHMRRMLTGKTEQFINEQFKYILDLYREGQETRRESLRKDALNARKTKNRDIRETRKHSDLIPEAKNNLDSDATLIDEIVSEMQNEF